MNASNEDINQLFTYFLTIFHIHYISWHKNPLKTNDLNIRRQAVITSLRKHPNFCLKEISNIESNARNAAKVYKKSVIVKTRGNEDLKSHLSLVMNTSNGKSITIGMNAEVEWDVEYMYDSNSDFWINMKMTDQTGLEGHMRIGESDISGITGYAKAIVFNENQFTIAFQWILNELSCGQHLCEPLLMATHFSTLTLCLGAEYWPLYRIPFVVLSKHEDIAVRRAIFSVLNEMAFIIRPNERLVRLLPIFETHYQHKEVSVENKSFVQNCVVFFDDLKTCAQMQVLKDLKPFLSNKSMETQKLKRVLIKKLMANVSDYSEEDINGYVIGFVMNLFETNATECDLKLVSKLYVLCAKKLFPQDLPVTEDRHVIDKQIEFLSESLKRFATNSTPEDRDIMINICLKLLEEGILTEPKKGDNE